MIYDLLKNLSLYYTVIGTNLSSLGTKSMDY